MLVQVSKQISASSEALTERQCQVLDLLLENKTSKEIARALRISPATVDQRILLARRKLQATSRNELTEKYRELRRGLISPASNQYQHDVVYEAQQIDSEASARLNVSDYATDQELKSEEIDQGRNTTTQATPHVEAQLVGPRLFVGSGGTFLRFAAIACIASLLVVLILGLLAIFSQISTLVE